MEQLSSFEYEDFRSTKVVDDRIEESMQTIVLEPTLEILKSRFEQFSLYQPICLALIKNVCAMTAQSDTDKAVTMRRQALSQALCGSSVPHLLAAIAPVGIDIDILSKRIEYIRKPERLADAIQTALHLLLKEFRCQSDAELMLKLQHSMFQCFFQMGWCEFFLTPKEYKTHFKADYQGSLLDVRWLARHLASTFNLLNHHEASKSILLFAYQGSELYSVIKGADLSKQLDAVGLEKHLRNLKHYTPDNQTIQGAMRFIGLC
jgi:hypothetical protein